MVNFVIHRDYSINDQAFVLITDQFIEFTNPGGSPYSVEELLSSDEPLHPKYQRNEQLIATISRTSLNQRQGGGIIRIRKALGEFDKSRVDDPRLEIKNSEDLNRFSLRISRAQRRQEIINQIDTSSHLIPYPPHQLKPTGSTIPRLPYFFGREKELAIIADAISPESRTWGALIDGPGGIGKTALAIHAAHLAPATLFDRKIFISAKVRELTPKGEMHLTDFSRDNYFSMLHELALELEEEGISRLAPDERANPLRMAMTGKKTLIVFDNLETLTEDERARLFQFLSRLPDGNKAIVTSRRRADVDARVIRLDRLSTDEAFQLMEELTKNNPRLAREEEKARRDLYEITNGNPLLIKWACGQLGREGSAMYTIAEAIKFIQNAPRGNDPLEYIFGDLLETFTESETKVLAALTHFTQPAKIMWVADMTGLAKQVTETALEDLADRAILIPDYERQEFSLPPLASQFIRSKEPEIVAETGKHIRKNA